MPESLDARAKRVIDQVLDLPPDEQARRADELCGPDAALRERVSALLAAAAKDDQFLRDPTMAGSTTAALRPGIAGSEAGIAEVPGASIGPYRLVEQIGEGGFGVVFRAEQDEPVRREVALKIVKLGMDTRAVVARFEQERQALAVMDHPNIARVFDAGATAAGRPYFVMELVRGEPITGYCDQRRLSIAERLDLFAQVCRAVQHAHTKGVIHRDIKPGNVLVHDQDGRPCCKVIDFGIAKATQAPLVERTVFTELRQLIGTPEYMSPEQAAGSLDIDTRSDVYALGVLLYELLAGVPPLDPRRLRSAAYGEMQRIIREEEPPAPSTRLGRSTDTLASVAASRRLEPRRLTALVRGDLDWIVLRALEKDRARRYDSAGSLADDVGRFLALEPVQAAPPSALYRLRKFVRRHRVPAAAGAAVAAALVLGLGAALWQAGVARRERDAARSAAAIAQRATDEAERRRAETDEIARFQASQLRDLEPARMGLTIRDLLLSSAREGLNRAGTDDAEIDRRQQLLGELIADANLTDVAVRTLDSGLFSRSLEAINREFDAQPLVRAHLLATLSRAMVDLGLAPSAEAPMREALLILTDRLGQDAPDTLEATLTMANVLRHKGDAAAAETMLRDALDRSRRALGDDHGVTLNTLTSLTVLLYTRFKLGEAEAVAREALERRLRLSGPDHLNTIRALSNVGLVLSAQGRMPEAEPYWREALERFRRVRGEDHPDTLHAMSNLGGLIRRTGRLSEAEEMVRTTLEKMRHVLGDQHPSTLRVMELTGQLWQAQGRLVEAERLQKEVLRLRRKLLGPRHQATLESLGEVGGLLITLGRAAEAEPLVREEVAGMEARYGHTGLPTGISRLQLARCLRELGRFAEAEAVIFETQRALGMVNVPADHQIGAMDLYEIYTAWHQAEPGKGYDRKADEIRAKLGPLPGPPAPPDAPSSPASPAVPVSPSP